MGGKKWRDKQAIKSQKHLAEERARAAQIEKERIEGDIKVQEEINKLLREEADGLKERYETLQAKHDALESQFQALQCEYDKLQLEHDRLYDSLKAEHDALKSKCLGLQIEHDDLLQKHKSTVKLLQMKGAKLDELRALAKGWLEPSKIPNLSEQLQGYHRMAEHCANAILDILNLKRIKS